MLHRRDMLRTAGAALAAPLLAGISEAQDAPKGPFTLPKLPYPADALEPHVDAKTMEIHHGKHHAAYVDNLNKAVAGTDWAKKSVEEILGSLKDVPEAKRAMVRNNGGGHWNHTFFWEAMSPKKQEPTGDLLKAIDASFGTLDAFKKQFKQVALGQFGSGWAWLVRGPAGGKPLALLASANQDNPLMAGKPAPLLGVDVWEHAYYLKYQNKRADYVDAWMNVVNWDKVAELYAKKA